MGTTIGLSACRARAVLLLALALAATVASAGRAAACGMDCACPEPGVMCPCPCGEPPPQDCDCNGCMCMPAGACGKQNCPGGGPPPEPCFCNPCQCNPAGQCGGMGCAGGGVQNCDCAGCGCMPAGMCGKQNCPGGGPPPPMPCWGYCGAFDCPGPNCQGVDCLETCDCGVPNCWCGESHCSEATTPCAQGCGANGCNSLGCACPTTCRMPYCMGMWGDCPCGSWNCQGCSPICPATATETACGVGKDAGGNWETKDCWTDGCHGYWCMCMSYCPAVGEPCGGGTEACDCGGDPCDCPAHCPGGFAACETPWDPNQPRTKDTACECNSEGGYWHQNDCNGQGTCALKTGVCSHVTYKPCGGENTNVACTCGGDGCVHPCNNQCQECGQWCMCIDRCQKRNRCKALPAYKPCGADVDCPCGGDKCIVQIPCACDPCDPGTSCAANPCGCATTLRACAKIVPCATSAACGWERTIECWPQAGGGVKVCAIDGCGAAPPTTCDCTACDPCTCTTGCGDYCECGQYCGALGAPCGL